MRLPEICIKRPVFAIVINLLLLIIGYIGFDRLPVRELPHTEQPVVEVRTDYRGASAELIENQLTIPIENLLASVEGVDSMASTSREGRSSITVRFITGYDINEGMNDIRDQLSRVRRSIPEESDDPQLIKADPSAQPIIYVSFNDSKRDPMALTDYVERYVIPEVQQVEGVGAVNIWGQRRYAVRVWPEPLQMAATGVTVNDIQETLYANNTALPSGEIKSRFRNYTINPQSKLNSVEEFQSLIIRDEDGRRVRMSDVALVEIGPRDIDSAVRVNGNTAVVMGITAQSTANPVDVSDEVRARLENMQNSLPIGMRLNISYDKATFINASINEVYKTIFEAVILVIIVMFAFLGSVRSSIIPLITIPFCLIASFGIMYLMGYTINTMTLLALVLAIGMVVDDAIVVLENVYRYIEEGMAPIQAAVRGSKEIAFAVVAMTLTLAAVYAPIGFTEGFTGDIFREFAFTLAGAVIISGFVALTLSPMMCAYILKPASEETRYQRWVETKLEALNQAYRRFLTFALQKRAIVVLLFVTLGGAGVWLFKSLPSELAPIEDTGAIIILLNSPTGSSFEYTRQQVNQLEDILQSIPERQDSIAIAGRNRDTTLGTAFLSLVDWDKRERSQTEILNAIRPQIAKIAGARVMAIELPPVTGGGGGSNPVDLVVQLSGSYEELYQVMDALMEAIERYPGLESVQSDLKIDSQQFDINFDRDLAANLGIDFAEINDAINILFAGRHITDFESGGENYEVVVEMQEYMRDDAASLNNIYLRANNGQMVPLAALISIEGVVKPDTLPHYDRMRSANLTANLAPGYNLSDAVAAVESIANEILPVNAKSTWSGFTKDYLEASGAMLVTVILALIFIYLVLSAQFESFIDPLVIMLTVPFSIIGALMLLKITGGTNNIYTQIGYVTLIGLITKHGILIVDFANREREKGKDKFEAVIEASVIRLRPILMTTGAMILGAVPLAFASGAGAVARSMIGWTIVGGMLFGTIFSLLVVPTAYTFLSRTRQAIEN
jgi:multidrug efflux pump